MSSLATLGVGYLFLVGTLALPATPIMGAPNSSPADGSGASLAQNITSMTTEDLQLNRSISLTTPSSTLDDFWAVECDQDAIPPTWDVPPEFHPIRHPYDCNRAIYTVTRGGGDPLEPEVWTSRQDWPHDSCGVYLIPSRDHARINFARIDIFEISYAILRKCVMVQHNVLGGWVSIGGFYIVLLTGSGSEPDS